uniref:Putative secreted peptide n=1 Tax=Anopheles braziliensis TaxID=58242 RepID=A0A2M3ZU27_9DIPT
MSMVRRVTSSTKLVLVHVLVHALGHKSQATEQQVNKLPPLHTDFLGSVIVSLDCLVSVDIDGSFKVAAVISVK